MAKNFRRELEYLINRYSKENGSDTPDFILADFLEGCLNLFDSAIKTREKWYGRNIIKPNEASTASASTPQYSQPGHDDTERFSTIVGSRFEGSAVVGVELAKPIAIDNSKS